MLSIRAAMLTFGALTLAAPVAQANAVEEFYKGNRLEIRIGYGPGGGYDRTARLTARHLAKYVPGKPSIVAVNMPGAASLRLTKWLIGAAPKDGSVIGLISRGIAMEPLLKAPQADFDPLQFNWIGNFEHATSFCATWHTAGITSLEDIVSGGKTLIVGGTGPASDDELFARVVRAMLGANVKIVSGYQGSSAVHKAMEQGEVNARCNMSAADIIRRAEWLGGHIRPIMQNGSKPHPRFTRVPLSIDLAKEKEQREVLRIFFARLDMGYPFVAPPGIPADRLEALRTAFEKMMADPQFIKEAEQMHYTLNPTTGEQLTELVKSIYASSPAAVAKASEIRNQAR